MGSVERDADSVIKYTVVVTHNPVEAVYSAHILALGIVTDGDTEEDAYVMAEDAINLWVRSALENGEELPADIELIEIRQITVTI